MLRNRILTALVLVPLVVAGVLWAPTRGLAIAFGLIVLLGGREMARLAGLRGLSMQWIYAVLLEGVIAWAYYWMDPAMERWLLLLAAAFWLGATLVLLARRSETSPVRGVRPLVLLLGALQLLIAWLSIIHLHGRGTNGPALMLFLLVLIWVADSAAYFAGRPWGATSSLPWSARARPGRVRRAPWPGPWSARSSCGSWR